MDLKSHFQEIFTANKDPFSKIIGNDELKTQVKTALLTGRHLIIVGPPGIGKTTLAKTIAGMLPAIQCQSDGFNTQKEENTPLNKPSALVTLQGNERFVRIQGSADLAVEDLIGYIDPVKALQFGPFSLEAFSPGKIFRANHGVLFFDEINRAPEKVQNSLLQVLEENEVTLGSYKITLPASFILIATMNPEDSSTERLSDVFIDRFDMVYMEHPKSDDEEMSILKEHARQELPISISKQMSRFIVALIRNLRRHKDLEKKPSVRATLGLYERSMAHAFVKGKKEVTLEDIEAVYQSVLAHRIRLNPSVKYIKQPQEILKEQFLKLVEQTGAQQDSGDVP